MSAKTELIVSFIWRKTSFMNNIASLKEPAREVSKWVVARPRVKNHSDGLKPLQGQ